MTEQATRRARGWRALLRRLVAVEPEDLPAQLQRRLSRRQRVLLRRVLARGWRPVPWREE